MKSVIRLVLFAVAFIASCIATVADVVLMIFKPLSKGGHVVEDWCEKHRANLAIPKVKTENIVVESSHG